METKARKRTRVPPADEVFTNTVDFKGPENLFSQSASDDDHLLLHEHTVFLIKFAYPT